MKRFDSKDPLLLEIIDLMNRCCGPFAKMPLDMISLSDDTLQKHNAIYLKDPFDNNLTYTLELLKILSSNESVATKKTYIDTHKLEIFIIKSIRL